MPQFIAELLILVLSIVNVSELVFLRHLSVNSQVYAPNSTFPPPSGLFEGGNYLSRSNSKCVLYRISSGSCPYCRADSLLLDTLIAKARSAGCASISILPRYSSPPVDAIDSLRYVSLAFGGAIDPFAVPQTFVVNHSGRLLWQHAGPLTDQSINQAVASMGSIR